MTTNETLLVAGCRVQIDRSGVGHCWRDVTEYDLTPTVREEIEGEIIDGGKDEGEITASNGLRYRWM